MQGNSINSVHGCVCMYIIYIYIYIYIYPYLYMHMVVGPSTFVHASLSCRLHLITSKTLCYNSRVLTRKTVQSDRLELVHQCAGTVRELDPPSRRGAIWCAQCTLHTEVSEHPEFHVQWSGEANGSKPPEGCGLLFGT